MGQGHPPPSPLQSGGMRENPPTLTRVSADSKLLTLETPHGRNGRWFQAGHRHHGLDKSPGHRLVAAWRTTSPKIRPRAKPFLPLLIPRLARRSARTLNCFGTGAPAQNEAGCTGHAVSRRRGTHGDACTLYVGHSMPGPHIGSCVPDPPMTPTSPTGGRARLPIKSFLTPSASHPLMPASGRIPRSTQPRLEDAIPWEGR